MFGSLSKPSAPATAAVTAGSGRVFSKLDKIDLTIRSTNENPAPAGVFYFQNRRFAKRNRIMAKGKARKVKKVALSYSGGLDTS